MKTIEYYPREKERVNQVREKAAAEKKKRLAAVDAFLKGQKTDEVSRQEIIKYYFRKYRDFFDNQIVETMKTQARYDLLKEIIYRHEIIREEEKNMGARKAAQLASRFDVGKIGEGQISNSRRI